MISTISVHASHGGTEPLAHIAGLDAMLDGRPEVSEQLIGLAVAGCYANTVLAEAAERGIWIRGLDVDAEVEWTDHPPRTRDVTVRVRIETDAGEPAVLELVEHADRVSRVGHSIRFGIPLRVADLRVTATPPGAPRA